MEGSDASTNFDKKTLNLDQANKTIKLETYLIFCKIVKKKVIDFFKMVNYNAIFLKFIHYLHIKINIICYL